MKLAGSVILAALCLSCKAAAPEKWDLASAFVSSNYHVENLNQFARDIDKATKGQLQITVHSDSTLFKGSEIKGAVQAGKIQAGEILMVSYEAESSVFGADGVPFLATSYSSARNLYRAQKPVLQKYLLNQGLLLLYCVPWPASGVYTKKPMESMSDMRGVKWRAYSPATTRMADLMGAQAVSVSAAELSHALSTGAVEAFMTSSQTGVDSRVHEHVRYFYDLQAALPKNAVFVNAVAFASLGKTEQAAVLKAAADAEERGWRQSQEWNELSKKTLAQRGMFIMQPSSRLAADVRYMAMSLLQDWQKKAGADGEAIVANYLRTPAFGPAPKALDDTPRAAGKKTSKNRTPS